MSLTSNAEFERAAREGRTAYEINCSRDTNPYDNGRSFPYNNNLSVVWDQEWMSAAAQDPDSDVTWAEGGHCSRCHKRCRNWKDTFAEGDFKLTVSSQAFATLAGVTPRNRLSWQEAARWIEEEGHPVVLKSEGQHIRIGYGTEETTKSYGLCNDCQRELVRLMGEFFGIKEAVHAFYDYDNSGL